MEPRTFYLKAEKNNGEIFAIHFKHSGNIRGARKRASLICFLNGCKLNSYKVYAAKQ